MFLSCFPHKKAPSYERTRAKSRVTTFFHNRLASTASSSTPAVWHEYSCTITCAGFPLFRQHLPGFNAEAPRCIPNKRFPMPLTSRLFSVGSFLLVLLLFSAYVGILIYQNIFVKNTFCKRTDTYPSYNKA